MAAVGSKTPSRRRIKISTRASGIHVEADIVDFGHGIAADNQRRLFEPFFTTKEHGLGLGLSICSTIIRAHGGKLSINNNEYGGATVVLSFLSAPLPRYEHDNRPKPEPVRSVSE
jgi:C4-dicarboxylate-specific signal transduction histidine kinase